MDSTAVGNDMVENGVPIYYVCARCIAFYAGGEVKFLGKIGCICPPLTDANRHLYDTWLVEVEDGSKHQFMRCFRCFLAQQECVAVC